MTRIWMALIVCLGAGVAHAEATPPDVPGSKDSPLVSRFPGSNIETYSSKAFDVFKLPIGPVGDNGPKTMPVEGKVTRFIYAYPADHSPVEVERNYEAAFKKAGFQTVYSCAGDDCGLDRFFPVEGGWDETWYGGGHYNYSAKLTQPSAVIYVNLHVAPERAFLDIIEVKAMTTDQVVVTAASLNSDIEKTGHVAVYGVYFDTGKSEVKPESAVALAEIGKLLQQNAALKVYIVGHTDNAGDPVSNLDLSRKRADAVSRELQTTYHVASTRLSTFGAGPYAPIASNLSEDGKAKNRRVELVQR